MRKDNREPEKILFTCPVCGADLSRRENSAVCAAGHSFDLARQGYLHLLLPNQMHSKIPGDSKQMVDARRRFLEGGHYEIFAEALCRLGEEIYQSRAEGEFLLADAGCGEGYYTGRLRKSLPQGQIAGFDISKFAVKAAAGKYKSVQFAVASIFAIPMPDNQMDLVTDVFAPIVDREFRRILKPGGFFLAAVPSRRHLFGMKQVLYQAPYENEEKDTSYEGFRFVDRIPVRGELRLTSRQDIWDLFSMTPYYWKTDIAGGQRLRELEQLETEIGFDFLLYQKL